ALAGLDVDRDQLAVERLGDLPGPPDQPLRDRVVANTDHHPRAIVPGQRERVFAISKMLLVHTIPGNRHARRWPPFRARRTDACGCLPPIIASARVEGY